MFLDNRSQEQFIRYNHRKKKQNKNTLINMDPNPDTQIEDNGGRKYEI